ncbi:lytic transglycosylase, partial [Streptomyces sp. DSM 44915]|nr:lytic transglycosylase [Streptomyces sp. DSM 44915]
EAYHVEGTSENIYDPVANIVAACNYAADRYGSMDNVDSAY